jgi:hypothetical protein
MERDSGIDTLLELHNQIIEQGCVIFLPMLIAC